MNYCKLGQEKNTPGTPRRKAARALPDEAIQTERPSARTRTDAIGPAKTRSSSLTGVTSACARSFSSAAIKCFSNASNGYVRSWLRRHVWVIS